MDVEPKILGYAREQRKSKNPWEGKLWFYLRGGRMLGYKFKRQVPIGRYIADFSCHEKRLIIELDGSQHKEPDEVWKDVQKEGYLKAENYRVLRFDNNDLDSNIEGVLETIQRALLG